MARLPKVYYLGLDKRLRRGISGDAFESIVDLNDPVHKTMGKKLKTLPHLNREQWKVFLQGTAGENKVTFLFVGHARGLEMVYFLNSLGARADSRIKVVLLLAEETTDTTMINKLNNNVKVVDYWKYVGDYIGRDEFSENLRQAVA